MRVKSSSNPTSHPSSDCVTLRLGKHLIVLLRDKAFKDSVAKMKPISTTDLVLKALKKAYPDMFKE